MLPNLFIVGQPKAGTTSLAQQLAQHKDIFLPATKEPHYMCHREGKDWYYYKQPLVYNKNKYTALYQGSKEVYRIDASVHYLRFESAAHEIKLLVPNAKIIAVIREPIDRISSHYLMDQRGGFVSSKLSVILGEDNLYRDEYIESSKVYNQLKLYINLFGKSNVLIINYDDYAKDNKQCLDNIISFIGLPTIEFKDVRANTFKSPKVGIKWVYSNYFARKIYGFITPNFIRKFIRKFIFDTEKPTIKFDETNFDIVMVKSDFRKILELISRTGENKVCSRKEGE